MTTESTIMSFAGLDLHHVDGALLIDSRLVAEKANILHPSLYRLLTERQDRIESRFGTVRFEIEPSKATGGGGDGQKHALLTENQAIYLVTLCRNTDAVMDFKGALVEAFDVARRRLQEMVLPAPSDFHPALPDFRNPAEAARAWSDQCERADQAMREAARLLPDAQFGRELKDSDGLWTITQVAKGLRVSGQRLNKFLKAEGITFCQSGTWMPYAKYQDSGYFKTICHTYEDTTTGERKTRQSLKVTPEGREFIHRRWRKHQEAAA